MTSEVCIGSWWVVLFCLGLLLLHLLLRLSRAQEKLFFSLPCSRMLLLISFLSEVSVNVSKGKVGEGNSKSGAIIAHLGQLWSKRFSFELYYKLIKVSKTQYLYSKFCFWKIIYLLKLVMKMVCKNCPTYLRKKRDKQRYPGELFFVNYGGNTRDHKNVLKKNGLTPLMCNFAPCLAVFFWFYGQTKIVYIFFLR